MGKSTLLNALMGVKLAIVTPRPQTTRNRIAGIKSLPDAQFVFLDTPGIHDPRGTLSRRLVRVAEQTLGEADIVVLVVDSRAGIRRQEREIAAALREEESPTAVALNKMDLIPRNRLLPLMEEMAALLPDRELVPINAVTGENVDVLLGVLRTLLPVGPSLYPEDALTDQTERFIAQEMIREKVFQYTRAEIPYASAVVTEEFRERAVRPDAKPLVYIRAAVLISRKSQRPIIIGKGGQRLKEIGRRARLDLERHFGKRFFVELFVKVEPGWEANPQVLHEVGL